MKELSSLKGADPKRPPPLCPVVLLGAKGFGVGLLGAPKALWPLLFAEDPKGLVDVVVAEPKALVGLLLAATEAKPPWLANPAKPPDEGAGADSLELWAALPNGLLAGLLFARLANPLCPKAGAEPPVEDQGEVLIPSCED